MVQVKVGRGKAFPLGPTVVSSESISSTNHANKSSILTVNVAVYAKVDELNICLFPEIDVDQVTRDFLQCIPFQHKTGDVWHIQLEGVPYDSSYSIMVPTSRGTSRLLTDPYAHWVESRGSQMWMTLEGENFAPKEKTIEHSVRNFIRSFPTLSSIGVEHTFRPTRFTAPAAAHHFDWGDEESPKLSYGQVVIYEAHIRGLSSAGTFEAAIEKIAYLKWLGVTALQLLPIFEFNELEMDPMAGDYALLNRRHLDMDQRRGNYWGYSPLSWFSPMNRYSEEGNSGGPLGLKKLVRALHAAGMEIYLDVVYNHTSNSSCALHFLKTQPSYYIGKAHHHGFKHSNISGCGNTLATARPMMQELVINSLRWWVTEYHVDGFRIDAAGVLCRDENGKPISNPQIIESMVNDPVLKETKFIVEGWDAGDQVGSPNFLLGSKHGFPQGDRFCEWNAKWRDDTRRYVMGNRDAYKPFREGIRGSPQFFSRRNSAGPAFHSVNFVSCHDGMCMADVVCFKKRSNKDGYDEVSFNCGSEGHTNDEKVLRMRARRLRNFILALGISRGIPMILQGDEIGATKDGFSNTWNDPKRFASHVPGCDVIAVAENKGEWMRHEGLIWFCKKVFDVRKRFEDLTRGDFMNQAKWLDMRGREKGGRDERYVAFVVKTKDGDIEKADEKWLYVGFYNGSHGAKVKLPDVGVNDWNVILDTYRWNANYGDGCEEHVVSDDGVLELGSHSAVVALRKA
ncbi:Isoamylase Iso1 [Gracilaria domingensis]|nr:Isoamylase Iso1 [Gracilaria domingensis]